MAPIMDAATAEPVPMSYLKYRNVPTDGYASKKEAKRAAELRLLVRAGKVRKLQEQVTYQLLPPMEGQRATSYRADFTYEELVPLAGGDVQWVARVEDVKGMRTQVYLLKRKMMRALLGITVREV